MPRRRVGILISGRGSNMRALIEATQAPDYPAEIVVVISNEPEAGGIEFARSRHIRTAIVNHRDYTGRDAYGAALDQALKAEKVEIVCLAGFMRMLAASFVERWKGQLINIHPSLLPAYKGLDTHARALADGAKSHGCTVHFVVPELDSGPIILQANVPILPGDDEESLAARVLIEEHRLYPEALRLVAEGRVKFASQ